MKHIIVGTAGHIDHGKTALVRALTGIDTDRLAEEKRRGITIDIGFANLRLADERNGEELYLGFVDVPGHERFVRNMLAGACGIDLVLMVIAADELAMPQTSEHFEICRLLGVRHGLVALTKADLVDAETLELSRMELEDFFAGSFLEGKPVIPVSTKTGIGLDELRDALAQTARETPERNGSGHFRMPLDRVFVQQGFGTVVTGTPVSGTIQADSDLEIHPFDRRVRVRGIQGHNKSVHSIGAGQRTALNLAGIEASELRRGMVAMSIGPFRATRKLDCVIELLASADTLKHGAPVHFHSGTAETVARVALLGRCGKLPPGEKAFARLRLDNPVLTLHGDRFILRRFSPVITIGGGIVLDTEARPERNAEAHCRRLTELQSGEPLRVLSVLLQHEPHGLEMSDTIRRSGWSEKKVGDAAAHLCKLGVARPLGPSRLLSAEAYRAAAEKTADFLKRFHRKEPLQPGASKEELRSRCFASAPANFLESLLASLESAGVILIENEFIRLPRHTVILDDKESNARATIIAKFETAGLSVPAVKDVLTSLPVDAGRARRILQALLRESILVKVSEDLLLHRDSIDRLKLLLRHERKRSGRIDVARFKELAGVSRKYAIPLLEFLDRRKLTRRDGNERVIL